MLFLKLPLRSNMRWEFCGTPMFRTPCFHFRGHGFNPWIPGQEWRSNTHASQWRGQEEKKKNRSNMRNGLERNKTPPAPRDVKMSCDWKLYIKFTPDQFSFFSSFPPPSIVLLFPKSSSPREVSKKQSLRSTSWRVIKWEGNRF